MPDIPHNQLMGETLQKQSLQKKKIKKKNTTPLLLPIQSVQEDTC